MSTAHIAILGAIAGFTIFLGLPIARLKSPSLPLRELLNATATGVLVFLLWDVLSHAAEPVEDAMGAATDHKGTWAHFVLLAAVVTIGLGVGLISLVYYERWMANRAGAARRKFGPGAMTVDEPVGAARPRGLDLANPARRLAMLIAVGIGLHNFSEGLAIGESAAAGELSLAMVLIVGFGLHNTTEGFGITAPLAAAGTQPSWGFLAVLGVVGGGPTLVGTLVGQAFVNETVYLGFLALAAGSILYVIVQLLAAGGKLGRTALLYWGLFGGLLLGFATDFLISAAGA